MVAQILLPSSAQTLAKSSKRNLKLKEKREREKREREERRGGGALIAKP